MSDRWWRGRQQQGASPRWKRFIIEGAILLVVAWLFYGWTPVLAGIVGLVGAVLVVAGLIGGAVNSNDDVGPRT